MDFRGLKASPATLKSREKRLAAATMVLIGLAGTAVHADTIYSQWTGTSSTTWSTASNWNPTTVPSTTVGALFDTSFTNQPILSGASTTQGIWMTTGVGQGVTINAASATNLSFGTTIATFDSVNCDLLLNDSAGNNLTIGPNITLVTPNGASSSTAFNIQDSGTLTIAGNLESANANGVGFTGDGTGVIDVTGHLIAGGGTGFTLANNLMILEQSNPSMSQGITVTTGGILRLNNAGTVPSGLSISLTAMPRIVPGNRRLSLMLTSGIPSAPQRLAVAKGIYDACRERGWALLQHSSLWLEESIRDWQPDAVIFVLDRADGVSDELLDGRIVVSAGEDLTVRGWPSVVPDDAEVGRQGALHLLERGMRFLAAFGSWVFADGTITHHWALRRMNGFAKAARGEGIEISRFGDTIDPATGRLEGTYFRPEQIQRWLAGLPKPAGVLALCDTWGMMLTMVCREVGLRVPEDIAIVSVDDQSAICEMCDPPMSSVAVPRESLGRRAAELVGSAAAGRRVSRRPLIVPPTGVTVRRSSDTFAVSDPDVATALAIIFAHADRPLTVSHILRQVPTTQRKLERHFKKLVGRRMIEEIRRVHVQRAKRLLAESDLSMPNIASQCGLPSASALSIAFRQETGTTPSKFRRRYRLSSWR